MRKNLTSHTLRFAQVFLTFVLALILVGPSTVLSESMKRQTSGPKQLRGKKKPEDKMTDEQRKKLEEAEKKSAKKVKKRKKVNAKQGSNQKISKGKKQKKSTKIKRYYEPFYRYRLNVLLGVNILEGKSGVVTGAQLGFALGKNKPLYLGPEVNFSLYSPGSIIQTLLGIWYQLRIYRSPRLSIASGLLVGASIPSNFSVVPNTGFTVFFEAMISQELNDLVSIRGQLRPGFIHTNFSFMMNLNVTFRFR